MQDREELGAWLRLLATPGVGPGTARRLLALGPPTTLWSRPVADWVAQGGVKVAQALANEPPGWRALWQRTWDWLRAAPHERGVLALGDPDYPAALLEIDDPPPLLFVQGRLERWAAWQAMPQLAVVGSRHPTPQGRLNAQAFARHLSLSGLCVVSGLAQGIDGAAHLGALDSQRESSSPGVPTVAVIGTGLDRVYPLAHKPLAQRITQHGLILSEYPLGTPPLNAHFPRRNRIISGLCQGILVVEATPDSGSLITARLALEQSREVMAIPGSIHSPQSRGCHALIRQGAKLVESAQDVLEEMRLPPRMAAPPEPLDRGPAHPLLAHLGHEPMDLDQLQRHSGQGAGELLPQLMDLELAGQIERLPGGRYQRLVRAG